MYPSALQTKMSAMEIDSEGVPQQTQTQPQTVFQWVSYVAVPFLGKVLKCIDGKPVELLDNFPVQNPPQQQPKPELKIKTPPYDEADFWASTPNSAYSGYTDVSGY